MNSRVEHHISTSPVHSLLVIRVVQALLRPELYTNELTVELLHSFLR